MKQISTVGIIYNPSSSGDSKKNAAAFKRQLTDAGVKAVVLPTKRAGHAIELARQFANDHPDGMVVSSSGDGGYHEVINGVLTSDNPDIITGLLPSGNANDHYNFVHSGNTVERIQHSAVKRVDVLHVQTPRWQAYAHSYIGLGLTSHIGHALNQSKRAKALEAITVVRNFFSIKQVRIRVRGKVRTYTNLVFSNSGRMAKVLTLSKVARIDDGIFEISRVRATSLVPLVRHLIRASTVGVDSAPQADHCSFTALRNMRVQLDGEIYTIYSGDKVHIHCLRRRLRTII